MKRYELTDRRRDVREAFVVMFGGEAGPELAYGVDTLEEADAAFDSYASDPSHDGHMALLLETATGNLAGLPRLVMYQPSN